MANANIKPVEEIRLGTIKAAVWKNIVDNGNNCRTIYNVIFRCLYRDGEGKWHSSESFGRDDLLVLAQLAQQTFDRIRHL